MRLHLSKYHIVENPMSRLICGFFTSCVLVVVWVSFQWCHGLVCSLRSMRFKVILTCFGLVFFKKYVMGPGKSMEKVFCLFDLILYVPSTIFQLYRDGSSWVEPVLS